MQSASGCSGVDITLTLRAGGRQLLRPLRHIGLHFSKVVPSPTRCPAQRANFRRNQRLLKMPDSLLDLTGCSFRRADQVQLSLRTFTAHSLPRPAVAPLTGDTLLDTPAHLLRVKSPLPAFIQATYNNNYRQSRIHVDGVISSFATACCQLSGGM